MIFQKVLIRGFQGRFVFSWSLFSFFSYEEMKFQKEIEFAH